MPSCPERTMMNEAVEKFQQFIESHPNLSLTRIDLLSDDTVMITVNDIRVDFNKDGPFNLEMVNIYNDWVQITDPQYILHITGQLNASCTPKESRLNGIIREN